MELDERGIPKVESFYWFKGRAYSHWEMDPSRLPVVDDVSEPYEVRIFEGYAEVFTMGWDIPNHKLVTYEGTWIPFDEKTFFPI